ncbi:MAG: N-acetyltransferase family protein [Nocardioides sp.]
MSAVPYTIRLAVAEDVEAVRAIRNAAIRDTTALWTGVELTPEAAQEWLQEHLERDAMLVAEIDGVVVGYAGYGTWRVKEGYRYTVDDSIYLSPQAQGRGIGRALLEQLIVLARDAGKRVMIADIEAGNTGSIVLHERLGFEKVGTIRQVGTKFDRWLDLTILSLDLSRSPGEGSSAAS